MKYLVPKSFFDRLQDAAQNSPGLSMNKDGDEFGKLLDDDENFHRWVDTIYTNSAQRQTGDALDPAARRAFVAIWKHYNRVLEAYLERRSNIDGK